MSGAAAFILLAWAIELAVGWPTWLFKSIRHPVVWLGHLITLLDTALNRSAWRWGLRYSAGAVATLVTVASATGAAVVISRLCPPTWWGIFAEAIIASSLIASRSLHEHVSAVAEPLTAGDLEAARQAVSMIVGRDHKQLDSAAIARASLESLAENASDGVIAPVFWGAIFGLPGITAYKAINTLDSMIGHRTERHEAFGGFAAQLDDLVNLIPARLTGFLFVTASFSAQAFKTMLRDANRHRSPNAGWPEAAMAGGLNIRLSGPRQYGNDVSREPWLNEGARDPGAQDVTAGLKLYWRALAIAAAILALIALGQAL